MKATFTTFRTEPVKGVQQIELATRMAMGLIDRVQQLLTMGKLPNSEDPIRTTMVNSLQGEASNLKA